MFVKYEESNGRALQFIFISVELSLKPSIESLQVIVQSCQNRTSARIFSLVVASLKRLPTRFRSLLEELSVKEH